MTKAQQTLYHVTVLTFEELAFLTQTDETPVNSESWETMGIDFHGDQDGQLILQIHHNLVPVIASNILGEFDTPNEEMPKDALCEVSNVICGNALPDIFGKKAIFHLTKPQPMPQFTPDEAFKSAQNSAEVLLTIEESCAVFGMPKEAIKLNAVDEILPLHKISSRVINYCAKVTEKV